MHQSLRDISTAESPSNNGFPGARSVGRSVFWKEPKILLDLGVPLGHGSGPACLWSGNRRGSSYRPLFRLGKLPSGWSSPFMDQRLVVPCVPRHTQSRDLVLYRRRVLAVEETIPVGFCGVGTAHSLRHSAARTELLSDSVPVAASNSPS